MSVESCGKRSSRGIDTLARSRSARFSSFQIASHNSTGHYFPIHVSSTFIVLFDMSFMCHVLYASRETSIGE